MDLGIETINQVSAQFLLYLMFNSHTGTTAVGLREILDVAGNRNKASCPKDAIVKLTN